METERQMEIDLPETVDYQSTRTLMAHMRAAVDNGLHTIVLRFTPDASIMSAEMLAFLHAVGDYQQKNRRELRIEGVNETNKALLQLVKLDKFIASVSPQ